MFISIVLPVNESLSSFVTLSGCVHGRSFSRPQTWSTQSNAWRSLCGVSSGLLIRDSLNTSVLPPKSAEWSSWPERRSRMGRYGSLFRNISHWKAFQHQWWRIFYETCSVQCVVIGLQSTGEARTLEALEEGGGELNDFVSTAKYR